MFFQCPVCAAASAKSSKHDGPDGGYTVEELGRHILGPVHTSQAQEDPQQAQAKKPLEFVCPVCAAMDGGDPSRVSRDLRSHFRLRHARAADSDPGSQSGSGKEGFAVAKLPQTELDLDDGLPPESDLDVLAKIRAAGRNRGGILTILGSGPSTGVPRLTCLRAGEGNSCVTCLDAVRNPHGKNVRRNPCGLVRLPNGRNILLDCGKSFREAVSSALGKCAGATPELVEPLSHHHRNYESLAHNYHYRMAEAQREAAAADEVGEEDVKVSRTLPPSSCPVTEAHLLPNVPRLDSLLITHSHADAFLGLDDLREFTEEHKISIYARPQDLKTIGGAFPYLMDSGKATGSGYVSQLQFAELGPEQTISGLQIHSIDVAHGRNCDTQAFVFGRVVWCSDVSAISDAQRERILALCGGRPEVLVLDATCRTRYISSHFTLAQALQEVRKMRPERTILVGMTHDYNYERERERLLHMERHEGLRVEPGYDGMTLWVESLECQDE